MRHLLFLVTTFTISQFVFAQNYNPMAVEGATWIYETSGPNENTMTFDRNFSGYHISGDTIVNDLTYKKLYNLTLTNDNQGNYDLSIEEENLYTIIRDDSVERKVYTQFILDPQIVAGTAYPECFEYQADNQEYLIYDFSLMEGDTSATCNGNVFIRDTPTNVNIFEINTVQHQTNLYEIIGNTTDIFYNDFVVIANAGDIRNLIKYYITLDFESDQLTNEEINSLYHPTVIEGATWLYKEELPGAPESLIYEGLHISGDSIVNGISYKVMHNVLTEISEDNSIDYISSYPLILIREDLENRKVYTHGSLNDDIDYCYDTTFVDRDYLLYDFQHIINDTVLQCSNSAIVLQGRSSFNAFGYNSVEYTFGSSTRFERFGQFYNFFFPYETFLTGETPNRELVAYCITDELGCPYVHQEPNSILDEQLANSINIFPNPTSSEIFIHSEGYVLSQSILCSIDGKILQSDIIDKKEGNHITIDQSITNGLYLIRLITTEGSITTKKVIVSR